MTKRPPPPPRPAASRERPAPPVFRDFVRTLAKLEGAQGQAPRPAREGAR
jgi:hypothetical protein